MARSSTGSSENGKPRQAAESRQGRDTRQALLETACELFGQYGYDAVSTRQIADAAQVNLGGIHYHFGGKEQLYMEAFQVAVRNDEHYSLGDMVRSHPELMETPEGQTEIIRKTCHLMLQGFREKVYQNPSKRMVIKELCSPSSVHSLLVREVLSPRMEGDLEFLRAVHPEASLKTLVAWANTLHAQMVFHLLVPGCMEDLFGPDMCDDEYFNGLGDTLARALTLLLGLPAESFEAEG